MEPITRTAIDCLRARMCDNKRGYRRRQPALMARNLTDRHLEVYKCVFCRLHHIGHPLSPHTRALHENLLSKRNMAEYWEDLGRVAVPLGRGTPSPHPPRAAAGSPY